MRNHVPVSRATSFKYVFQEGRSTQWRHENSAMLVLAKLVIFSLIWATREYSERSRSTMMHAPVGDLAVIMRPEVRFNTTLSSSERADLLQVDIF
jgi:hypothetical protein